MGGTKAIPQIQPFTDAAAAGRAHRAGLRSPSASAALLACTSSDLWPQMLHESFPPTGVLQCQPPTGASADLQTSGSSALLIGSAPRCPLTCLPELCKTWSETNHRFDLLSLQSFDFDLGTVVLKTGKSFKKKRKEKHKINCLTVFRLLVYFCVHGYLACIFVSVRYPCVW